MFDLIDVVIFCGCAVTIYAAFRIYEWLGNPDH